MGVKSIILLSQGTAVQQRDGNLREHLRMLQLRVNHRASQILQLLKSDTL